MAIQRRLLLNRNKAISQLRKEQTKKPIVNIIKKTRSIESLKKQEATLLTKKLNKLVTSKSTIDKTKFKPKYLKVEDFNNIFNSIVKPEIKKDKFNFETKGEAFEILNEYFSDLTKKEFIIFDLYGKFIEHGKDKDNWEYITDNTFTKFLKQYYINDLKHTDRKIKFNSIIAKLIGSSGDDVTGIFYKSKYTKGKKYDHKLKFGDFNCVMNVIKHKITKMSKLTIEKINNFNKKYFKSGVRFMDLPEIAKSLFINISVVNKLNIEVYSTNKNNKNQTIILSLESLNHVEPFKLAQEMKNKKIIYVEDVDKHYNDNDSNNLMFKKIYGEQTIKYYWDENNIYKNKETEKFDNDEYHINDLSDLYFDKFLDENKLNNNKIFKNNDIELFEYVNNSVHNYDEIFFINNIEISKDLFKTNYINDKKFKNETLGLKSFELDMSKYFCYDRNKHFVAYKDNKYYKNYGIPKSGKFNLYKINEVLTDDQLNKLLLKCGFGQISNINIENQTIRKLKYFRNGYVYPIPILKWAIDNNITFKLDSVAINNFIQTINFNDEIINNKFFCKYIGIMQIKDEYKSYNLKCYSEKEAQDIQFYCKSNEIKSYYNKEFGYLSISKINDNISNMSHIASYIMGYAVLEIMDKLKQINFNDIIGVKVDCIILKKPYDIFNLSSKIGDWKIENKKMKQIYLNYNYINEKTNNYNFEYVLTDDKINYENINLISGSAGCGKTTRFSYKFDTDETLKCIYAFPNNNLCNKFKNANREDIKTSTYHKLFNIGCYDECNKLQYVTNCILDESTMINLKDMTKIIKMCELNNVNLFITGDFDYKTKKIFQIKPVEGESFLKYEFKSNIFYKHLIKNYRQNKDLIFSDFLNNCRGNNNIDVLKSCNDINLFKFINYDELIKSYNINDIIISPFDIGSKDKKANSDFINNELYKTNDILNVKYIVNRVVDGVKVANNEDLQINKDKFNEKTQKLAFCVTSHIVQGIEYDENKNIYVINHRYFTDNQLYVILSRAKLSKQIIFVNI